jgi:hypothetical protein
LNIWIQKHDFSDDERDNVEIDDALASYKGFDWDAEILKEEEANAKGIEGCPPGMGLVSDDNRILHLVPKSRGAEVYYDSYRKKKFLGLFEVSSQGNTSVIDFPDAEVKEAVRLHYEGENELLIDFLNAFGKPFRKTTKLNN